MSLPLKLDFSNYDNFLTEPDYTTSAEAQDYFRNMDMLVEALIDVGLWQPETNYPNGHVVFSPNMPNGTEAVCVATNGGKSSNTEPSWGEVGGDNVSDGTCFWKLRYKHWSKSVEEIADLTTGATNRLPNKAYAVGNVVYTDSNLSVALKCITAGTASADELDISTNVVGSSITDGSVVWKVIARSNVLDEVEVLPIPNGGTGGNAFIESASISGRNITLNMSDGTTKTLTTQDTNNYYMPNWSGIVTGTTPDGTERSYTAPSNGYISCQLGGFDGAYATLKINNKTLYNASTDNAGFTTVVTAFIPVNKGDVIKYKGKGDNTTELPRYFHFIPAKTV